MESDIEVMEGDCRVLMANLPNGSVDAIVTDPPYGTEVAKGGYGRRAPVPGGVARFIEGDVDLEALDGMLGMAGRVLRHDAWLAIFCSPKRHRDVANLCVSHGFTPKGEVVWDKVRPGIGAGIRYQHECILLCPRGKAAGRSRLLSIIHAYRLPGGGAHPHTKPVALMRSLVEYCSRPGEIVLDPFAGSGSTLVACLKTGRKGIGMEIDPKYLPLIRRRLEESQMTLFPIQKEGE